MLERTAYAAGRTVKWLVLAGAASLVVIILVPDPPLAIGGLVFCAIVISYAIQVLGYVLAALAVGARLRVSRSATAKGFPLGFRINHGPVSTGRHAIVLVGGPLANLAAAGIVLVLPLPRAIASSVAVLFAAHAVVDLVPVRSKDGRMSAGAQLLGLRSYGGEAALLRELEDFWANRDSPVHSPEPTNRVLAAYREGVPAARDNVHLLAMMLRREGRVAELLELHAGAAVPDELLAEANRGAFVEFEWNVLAVPGLPVSEANRAAARLERLPAFSRQARQIFLATTQALARLRQGRFADVEPLCADPLAGELEPDRHAQVLATVALARRALGQPYSELIAEAESLAPDDDLVGEATAARLADR